MIATLAGTIAHVGLDHLVVETGGVGLHVLTTPAIAAEHRTGQHAALHTTLIVREESLTLYGFSDADGKALFEQVQTVSGVGPRLAMAMLSVLAPSDVRRALSQGDIRTLTKVPGIGKKGAERMVLELRDKMAAFAATAETPEVAATPNQDAVVEQVTSALMGLGWSNKQAGDAVATVTGQPDSPTAVSAILRASLKELGR